MNTHSQIMCLHDGDAFEVTNSNLRQPAQWLYDSLTGWNRSDSGVSVNGYTCLTHCPLWQGVNIIAGDIGQVPIRLVRNEFFDQKSHPAWKLLRVRPNELQTASLLKETLMQWALIWGNFVGWIVRRGAAVPSEIIPLRPDCLRPELLRFEEQQVMLYHYYSPITGREYTFLPDDVIHIQGLTGDGVWGYPLWHIAKNTIGHGLALQRHGNNQFSNGARPSGVLKHPNKMSPEAREHLRSEWNSVHAGPDNSGKIAVLWEGMEFQAMQMTNSDAEWLDAVKFDVYQAASLLNIPPHRLGAMEDSSVRANLEEQNETYKQMTLTRWANKLDEEFRRKLLRESEWQSDEYRFIFDFDTFLRADIDTRSTVADRLTKATIWNPNEARRFMGYAPREGGEVYGNPAINPNEPSGTDRPPSRPESEDAEEEPDNRSKALEAAHKDALHALLVQALKMESRLLKQAAEGKLMRDDSNARNFIEWIDEFYLGDGAPSRIVSMLDSIMGKSLKAAQVSGINASKLPETVQNWALSRHAWLSEACSNVTAKDLPSAVESFAIASPEDHATSLLEEAMSKNGQAVLGGTK